MTWIMIAAFVATMGTGRMATVARAEEEKAHFHHVHLNVVDPAATIKFYKKFFSAVEVDFRGANKALLTDRSFILMTKVETAPTSDTRSAIWHMGWGGVDGPSEYEWRKREGVEFESELTPLGNLHFMYAYGPDGEVIEIWTGFHHNRFGHIHLFADDINTTAKWYAENLGLAAPSREIPKPPAPPEDFDPETGGMAVFQYLWMTQATTDAVTINIFGKPGPEKPFWWKYDPIDEFETTDGRAIDHIAFSYRDIEPVFERMKAAGIEIVDPINERAEYAMKSFFVRGPDGVLVEIVEDRPLPEGIWDHAH